MNEKIYYKVLSLRRFSAINHKNRLKYPLKTWVTPEIPFSKLMVFATLEDAERFVKDTFEPYNHKRYIHKCYIKGKKVKKLTMWDPFDNKDNIRRFWKNYKKYLDLRDVPKGTIFARAVYCID
jgi:hypothetical protein